jgi:hypothetical protein
MRLNGNQLKESEKHIQLRGEGQWNAFPCLLSEATPVMEALADYYDYASPGDLCVRAKDTSSGVWDKVLSP